MTHYIVKISVHDFPKRSQFLRGEVRVEAGDIQQAMEFGLRDARDKWPGGKCKAFDVIVDRNPQPAERPLPYTGVNAPSAVMIDGVVMKRGPGRPRKLA